MEMLARSLSLMLAMASVVPLAAFASTADLDRVVLVSIPLTQGNLTPTERRDIAEQSLAYWKSFDSRVPRISPADRKWLEKELSTTDTKRLSRAVNTPQYALSEVEFQASNCMDLFEKLVPAVGSDKFLEMYLWLKTVSCYAKADQTGQYLQQAGLSNGNVNGPFSYLHFGILLDLITGRIANSIAAE